MNFKKDVPPPKPIIPKFNVISKDTEKVVSQKRLRDIADGKIKESGLIYEPIKKKTNKRSKSVHWTNTITRRVIHLTAKDDED
jgi:hypothetical protein